ncbi:hypothetical protein RFI_26158 [Reticulomyxa filosa]|uniref:Uncharacterized protein n=1 Tax=Reticulomyxa filosa TaxID=46433 RepID=X6MCN9_RETFI|nr:hypothetical protein RFI_26158 [Reticulomyxa filosa]|eukprot:ETO11217.1 hypothetical protein RFI_26158 [Reticulomyxa filosa]
MSKKLYNVISSFIYLIYFYVPQLITIKKKIFAQVGAYPIKEKIRAKVLDIVFVSAAICVSVQVIFFGLVTGKILIWCLEKEFSLKARALLASREKAVDCKDVALMEPQQWINAFTHVRLALIPKKKLLKTVNQMRENEKEKLLDVDKIVSSEPSSSIPSHITIWQKYMTIYFYVDNSDKREIACIFNTEDKITRKLCTPMTIWRIFCWKYEKRTRFNIEDDKWKSFGLKNGDEIFCEYSLKSNSNAPESGLSVDNIKFPVLYRGEVNEDNNFQFIPVQQQETKVKLVNDSQKKEKWRIGDKVEFRCKYHNDAWTAVDIKILQRAPLFSLFLKKKTFVHNIYT